MKTVFYIVSVMCLLVSINIMASDHSVEKGLARFVADAKAHNYHQTKKIHRSDMYYDLNGEINAYVFTYALTNNASDKEHNTQKNGVEKAATAVLLEVTPTVSAKKFLEKKQQLTTLRQQQTDPQKTEQTSNELRKLEAQMRQRDRFVTIVISATLTKGPVLDRYFGLPHHVYKKGLISAKAKLNGVDMANDAKVIMASPQELYFSSETVQTKKIQGNAAQNSLLNTAAGTSLSVISINDGSVETKPVPHQLQKKQTQAITIDDSNIPKEWKIYRSIYQNREFK